MAGFSSGGGARWPRRQLPGGCGCFFFFCFLGGGEVFFGPLVAADAGFFDGAAVDDYVLDVIGLDGETAEVEGAVCRA